MTGRLILIGAGALGAGLAKMRAHMASADPFAAFWCRTPAGETGLVASGGEWLAFGHCWGCYAAALGAGMLALAGWRKLQALQIGEMAKTAG